MISFILRFKVYLAVIAIIVFIECAVAYAFPNFKHATNFFEFAYHKHESLQKFIVFEKIKNLTSESAQLVTFGDSSGKFGVQPEVVGRELGGLKVVNFNVAGDTGYTGYRHLVRYVLNRKKDLRFLILSITPYEMPAHMGKNNALAKSIDKNFLGLRTFFSLPSFSIRLPLTNALYYGKFEDRLYQYNEPDPKYKRYPSFAEWSAIMAKSKGWLPYPVHGDVHTGECDFRVNKKDDLSFEKELDQFADLAKKANVKLAVVINPVACDVGTGEYSDAVQKQFDSFSRRHPEVFVPFDLVTTWPAESFGDNWHLFEAGSVLNSERIGRALKPWVEGKEVRHYYGVSDFSQAQKKLEGVIQSYDTEGRLKAERLYQNGVLQGVDRIFDPSGAVQSERSYELGKLNGPAKQYFPDGTLKAIDVFSQGKLIESKQFYPGQRLKTEKVFLNERHIADKMYYEDGKLAFEIPYKNDQVHGEMKAYYVNGALNFQGGFRKGKRDGVFRTYDPESRLFSEISYHRGNLDGPSRFYYPSGKVREENLYQNQILHGVTTAYYESGAVFQKLNYRHGQLEGSGEVFHEAGYVVYRDQYRKGQRVSRQTFDSNGQKVGEEKTGG